MFSGLSAKQKEIVDSDRPRILVKACPGSGKTYSVSARLASLMHTNTFKHNGIAAISFTKVAGEEIRNSLRDNFGIADLNYPHFIGTIDSFINKHIFFPFGHLIMNCGSRPEIVGTEFNKWHDYDSNLTQYFNRNGKRIISRRDPNYYFDIVSFDMTGDPIQLLPASSYPFSWKKLRKKDESYTKVIQDIINAKWKHFEQGKANQSDANYFSLLLLKKYPLILKSLVKKYSHLIIDEAQDTTSIQMGIINLFDSASIDNIILVGDPDQAVFEWNTADSELFMEKFRGDHYFNIELSENRRCSDKICKVLNTMVDSESTSISDTKEDDNQPRLLGYETAKEIQEIKDAFLEKCDELEILHENSAIVFRGNKFGQDYFNLSYNDSYDNPWISNNYHVRDIVQGKFLMEIGKFKYSLNLLERGLQKLINPDLKYVSKPFLKSELDKKGYRNYREELFIFINLLPSIKGKTLIKWVAEVNEVIGVHGYNILNINNGKSHILIKDLFNQNEEQSYSFNIGTIHSVKGKTFDASILFLKKDSATKNYTTLLAENYKEVDESKRRKDKEELRLVYVACSRPKRLLWIATPKEDLNIWKNYLGVT